MSLLECAGVSGILSGWYSIYQRDMKYSCIVIDLLLWIWRKTRVEMLLDLEQNTFITLTKQMQGTFIEFIKRKMMQSTMASFGKKSIQLLCKMGEHCTRIGKSQHQTMRGHPLAKVEASSYVADSLWIAIEIKLSRYCTIAYPSKVTDWNSNQDLFDKLWICNGLWKLHGLL